MKTQIKTYLFICCILFVYPSFGQEFGNEWVNPNQEYFKLQVKANGIYRVSYQELLAAGFPINSIDPRRLQLWFRGQQRAIWVEGEADGTFDEGDYIEFYGQLNDATLDMEMYDDPANNPNPYRNIYSNHTSYFLTYALDGSFGNRMPLFYESNTTIAPVPYYTDQLLANPNFLQIGAVYPSYISFNNGGSSLSTLTSGAGFLGYVTGHNDAETSRSDQFYLGAKYIPISGDPPVLSWKFYGHSNGPHKAELYIGPDKDNVRLVETIECNNYETYFIHKNLELTDLSEDGFVQVALDVLDVSPSISREVLGTGYFRFQFTRTGDLLNRASVDMILPVSSTGKSRMALQNPPSGARVFDITDPNNMRIIGADLVNGQLNAVIDQTRQQRTVLVTSSVKTVDFIEEIQFSPIPENVSYLIVSHKDLMVPARGYDDPVQAYADYRTSVQGGDHQVYSAEINELFNYFTYGEPTPLAIRRCIKYMQSNGNNIEHLFLVGKALEATYEYFKKLPESASWSYRNLVPCMGLPCSDVLLTANLYENTQDASTIPTGRLSALNAHHVADYLDKVKDHENQTYDELSRKRTLFLSGGATNNERRLLRSYVQQLAYLTENRYLGAKSKIYSKETTSAVEIFDVSKEVNEGLNLITLFGHTASNFTDIDIRYPQDGVFNYNNKGKYPMIIVNGCNSGDIFEQGLSLGEFWNIAQEKGSIAYIAHSDLGYPSRLQAHTLSLLKALYADSTTIHQSIGKALVQAQHDFISTRGNDPLARAQLHQYTFQGDPAIKLFPVNKPDYHVTSSDLFIRNEEEGKTVTADTDAFLIGIDISNLGITSETPVNIRVKRIFNNGINGEKWYPNQIYSPVYYQDTLYYRVEASEEDKQNAVGVNRFEIYIDADNSIDEMNEANNQAVFDYIFPRSAIRLLYPESYGIVSEQPVKLTAQNLDMLPTTRDYIFQLDTTDAFNSAYLKQNTVTAAHNPSWTINELISNNKQDSIVYYWRIKFATIGELDDANWASGSFIYIKDSPNGWAQSEPAQFKTADLADMKPTTNNQDWQFAEDTVRLSIKTTGGGGAWGEHFLMYNDLPVIEAGNANTCEADALLVFAVDYETGRPYNKLETENFYATCGFMGTSRAISMIKRLANPPGGYQTFPGYLAHITNNHLDSGDYIFIMSLRNIPFSFLRTSDMEAMERMGIPIGTLGSTVRGGEPFIAMGRLDVPGYEAEIYTADYSITDSIPANQQEIFADFVLPIRKREGTALSSPIGPAVTWGSSKHYFGIADNANDYTKVDLIGVRPNGEETELMNNIGGNITDLSGISPQEYPYLRLKATFRDRKEATPQPLKHWEVIYEGMPEGLLYFDGATASFDEPLSFGEGEDATFQFKFQNMSNIDFTSPIVFQYSWKKPNNTVVTAYDTLTSLKAGASVAYSKTFNTLGFPGENELTVFANPLDQKELHYDNNILQRKFDVLPDQINPVLDVAFDGVRIMDGDIVSPSPIISIGLTDENPYYTLSDTASLAIYLSAVNTSDFVEVPTIGNPAVKWVEEADNALRIEYSPDNLEDGVYRLRVQARDASGNASGAQPYEVSFEVINASQITHFYPYPNPFSTSVRFVFTLTGSKIPDKLRVQIMTVTGKVVREITQEELGAIHIGNNITQYAWDGKDEYGDQLANGTYLYRVIADYGGQAIERRKTSKDNLFKNNIGKMYLLR